MVEIMDDQSLVVYTIPGHKLTDENILEIQAEVEGCQYVFRPLHLT